MRFRRRNQLRVFNTMMRQSSKFNRVRERMTLDATSTRMNPNSSTLAMIVITLGTRELKIFKSRSRRTESIKMMM